MTKLEQKLIELGYIKLSTNHISKLTIYHKDTGLFSFIEMRVYNPKCTRKYRGSIVMTDITSQKDIDEIQQAFNHLQNDLEELKKC